MRWRAGATQSHNRNGERGHDVIPHAVIERPPSAELRADQTDQDSLPPYDVLDAILARFIEGEQSEAEIIAAGYEAEDGAARGATGVRQRIQAPPVRTRAARVDPRVRARTALPDQHRLALIIP